MTAAAGGPYAFHLHLGAWLVIVAVGVAYGAGVRRVARRPQPAGPLAPAPSPSRRQWWWLAAGLFALALALTWPVADLAAHWSLTALVVQRLLITLAAVPLLLLAVPTSVFAAVTRPAPVDRVLEVLTRPVVAVVTFTVVAVGTLLTPAVAAQASSPVARAGVDALLVAAGAVLWGPVLRHIPGASRPSAVGLAAYLFVQSIVPGFPAIIYVFARHPLYRTFAHAHAAIGLSPLNDQELAGVVAKMATLPVLWSVAWVALARAQREDADDVDTGTLTWAEVERHLERAERMQRRRSHSRRRRPPVRPRVGWPPGETVDDGPDSPGVEERGNPAGP